jgi:putative transposase
MFKSTKYRLYPNKEQEILLAKHFGCARFVYNYCLNAKKAAWEERKENLTRYDLCALLPKLKKEEETSWLSEVNAQSLQGSLVSLDMAFTKFFHKQADFPKFKNKFSNQSFTVPQDGRVEEKSVWIPKLHSIRAAIDRPVVGKIKKITISKTTTGKYFASALCDDGEAVPSKLPVTEERTIGIDLGLKTFATLSTGEKIENPRHLKKSLARLRRAQRKSSRRKKGSSNRKKQNRVVACIHEKVTNRRNDFLHKLTTRLVHENQTDSFAIEDLAVENMMKNHRLARAIGDAGWSTFVMMLTYKAERLGKNILTIGRYEPSSKSCSCGIVNKELKLSDRVWTCQRCGKAHDRDLNAAQNIKRFALHPQQSVRQGMPESTLEECVV